MCKVAGCGEPPKARGFCKRCYAREWMRAYRSEPSNADKVRANSRRYYEKNSDKISLRRDRALERAYRLRRLYGVSPAEVDIMLRAQSNKCCVCKKEFSSKKPPNIDHCHGTKNIRGILCNQCNQALGLLNDSQDALRAANEYLNQEAIFVYWADGTCIAHMRYPKGTKFLNE
jgi:hypothetical protein